MTTPAIPFDIIGIIHRVAIGQHWKSSTTGYVIAAAILAYYFFAVWHRGETVDINWIMLALTAAGGGRAFRDPRGTKRVKPPKPPTTPAVAGFASSDWLLVVGVIALFAAIMLSASGCSLTTSGAIERVNGGFDAADGKVLGVIPADTAATALDKVGLTGFRKFEEQLEDMRKLYQSVPAGTDLIVGLRRISTREPLPWDDIEMTAEMKWSSKVVMPVPDAGSRATLRIITPVQPAEPNHAAPVANLPNTAGGTTTNTIHPLNGPANASVVQ